MKGKYLKLVKLSAIGVIFISLLFILAISMMKLIRHGDRISDLEQKLNFLSTSGISENTASEIKGDLVKLYRGEESLAIFYLSLSSVVAIGLFAIIDRFEKSAASHGDAARR